MAYVNAANQNWNTDNLQFEIKYHRWRSWPLHLVPLIILCGISWLNLVDKGIFRRVGDCYSLALFVIAVREDVLENIKDYQNNFRYN
jgi:hypothetical protein